MRCMFEVFLNVISQYGLQKNDFTTYPEVYAQCSMADRIEYLVFSMLQYTTTRQGTILIPTCTITHPLIHQNLTDNCEPSLQV